MNIEKLFGQERASSNNFRIAFENLPTIYSELDQSCNAKGFIPTLSDLGSLQPTQGVFSSIKVGIDCDVPNIFGYLLFTKATFRSPEDSYFSSSEKANLLQSLQKRLRKLPVEQVRVRDAYDRFVIKNPKAGVQYWLSVHDEDEAAEWLTQVKLNNSMLKNEQFREYQQDLEKNIQALINSPYPVYPAQEIDIIHTHIDNPPDLLTPNKLVDPNGMKDFQYKMKDWSQVVQEIIRATADIKGGKQSGKLVIRPTDLTL